MNQTLEITEYPQFIGSTVSATSVAFQEKWYLGQDRFPNFDDPSNWIVVFNCCELDARGQWAHIWEHTILCPDEWAADEVRGVLRFGELLCWNVPETIVGGHNPLQLRRLDGEITHLSMSERIYNAFPIWNCDPIHWAIQFRNTVHLLDKNLQLIGSVNFPVTNEIQRFDGLHWTLNVDGLTLLFSDQISCLWSSHFTLENKEFSPWAQQNFVGRSICLPSSKYISMFFSTAMGSFLSMVRYDWNASAKRFHSVNCNRRISSPDDFNRAFAISTQKDVFVVRSIDGHAVTYLPDVPADHFHIGKPYCDQRDEGTVWHVTEGKLLRFRLAQAVPTLSELAIDAYAEACFDSFDTEALKSRFANAIDSLSARMNARTWRVNGKARRWLLTQFSERE